MNLSHLLCLDTGSLCKHRYTSAKHTVLWRGAAFWDFPKISLSQDISEISPKLKSKFWIEVIKSWSEYNSHVSDVNTDIKNETLWFN